ncbi:hypothetical protein [Alteromonas sp. BMJM2]|uniref:hypothetical protein n=1 Tax=Alteromonas sp. BMJM2 TaxID=2954241 RepID=UPI0022B5C753|nr:hypothetical protein [Alteromonas sp. BMJM2]
MENQENPSFLDEMNVSMTNTTEEQADESGIACAVVCCCAIATICIGGCLLTERALV